MRQTRTDKEILITPDRYGERNEIVVPHQSKGFTLENENQINLCPFYEFCLRNKGLFGQISCLKNNNIICKDRALVKKLTNN